MKKYILLLILSLFVPLSAALKLNAFFVDISDILGYLKEENTEQAHRHLEDFKEKFLALEQSNSLAAKDVIRSIDLALKNLKIENIEKLSASLIEFEKEQNPIDYNAKILSFKNRMLPLYDALKKANDEKNIEQINVAFKRFYDTWQRNERVVGDLSFGHYGIIESAMSFYRMASLSEDFATMDLQLTTIHNALNEFIDGKFIVRAEKIDTASEFEKGLKLLRGARAKFESDESGAKADIMNFIIDWPVFEGEVSTRDSSLYNDIESMLPQIAAKGAEEKNLATFDKLIERLESLDVLGSYTIIDVMLVLLREGFEALLIVVALLSALKVGTSQRAKAFILGGAGLGILLSIIIALVLSFLFPLSSAGRNREILEGGVGIIAVLVMIFVISWLHSKSNTKAWESYIKKQLSKAISTSSLLGLGFLSFLAVFREGAETILFYAAMLPKMEISSFVSGIVIASLLLLIIAYFINFITTKIAIHRIFLVMSILLYVLGFKILGLSIHALQLTSVLPSTLLNIPSISIIGFYNNIECLASQMIYLLAVIFVSYIFRFKEKA